MKESRNRNTALSPPLKWAGGKRWQLPHLRPLWEEHQDSRLVEPFCGGLAVSLGLRPQQALLNDINPHLVNFYSWLQKGLRCDIKMKNEDTTFYAHRQRFNELIHTSNSHTREAAALFYYLNRTGYNGLCRFNNSGEFNVPFGRYKRIPYVTNFLEYRQIVKSWEFRSDDFSDLDLTDRDFVYADPPYDVEFTAYAKGGFSWDDQVRIATWLIQHTGPVILVNQATPRIKKLYRGLGFKLRYLDGPRRLSANGDRTPAREVFATRNIN